MKHFDVCRLHVELRRELSSPLQPLLLSYSCEAICDEKEGVSTFFLRVFTLHFSLSILLNLFFCFLTVSRKVQNPPLSLTKKISLVLMKASDSYSLISIFFPFVQDEKGELATKIQLTSGSFIDSSRP